jgi:hypothetical protein
MVSLVEFKSKRDNESEILIAIDPGITSGVAIKVNGTYQTCVAHSGAELWEFIRDYNFSTVIIEQFATSSLISKFGLRTAELVGGVEALCWLKNIPIVRRMPAQRIPFLRKAALLLKDTAIVEHQQDALAHLLAWEGHLKSEYSRSSGTSP